MKWIAGGGPGRRQATLLGLTHFYLEVKVFYQIASAPRWESAIAPTSGVAACRWDSSIEEFALRKCRGLGGRDVRITVQLFRFNGTVGVISCPRPNALVGQVGALSFFAALAIIADKRPVAFAIYVVLGRL